MFPIIFRPSFFCADRPYYRYFQTCALKLGFVKKTVTLRSLLTSLVKAAVPNQLSFHGLVTKNFWCARYEDWLKVSPPELFFYVGFYISYIKKVSVKKYSANLRISRSKILLRALQFSQLVPSFRSCWLLNTLPCKHDKFSSFRICTAFLIFSANC